MYDVDHYIFLETLIHVRYDNRVKYINMFIYKQDDYLKIICDRKNCKL